MSPCEGIVEFCKDSFLLVEVVSEGFREFLPYSCQQPTRWFVGEACVGCRIVPADFRATSILGISNEEFQDGRHVARWSCDGAKEEKDLGSSIMRV